ADAATQLFLIRNNQRELHKLLEPWRRLLLVRSGPGLSVVVLPSACTPTCQPQSLWLAHHLPERLNPPPSFVHGMSPTIVSYKSEHKQKEEMS
ncbi:hypothetical protein ATANTOWER_019461, partial [Ataeniobius toweri]|nr:hypothetical protein [Ataeniobius toweri]